MSTNYYIVESKVGSRGTVASYHVAARDAADAIYEAAKTYSKAVFNTSGPFLVGFRRARAAQQAFIANVVSVVKAMPDAAASTVRGAVCES